MIRSVIIGTGSHIPELLVSNESFQNTEFYDKSGEKMDKNNKSIIQKFAAITGIAERRYAPDHHNASDLGYFAAREAITDSGIDQETLDYLIVAHNFGDVPVESNRSSQVPSIASRIKALLQIRNPDCVAYDLPFGCPGWVEALIQANYYLKSGEAKRCLIIGTETLSRIVDPHDRDSMIFSDGAGAAILEASADTERGIIAHKTQTHAVDYISALNMGPSYFSYTPIPGNLYMKMDGRKVYEFALSHVPAVIKTALEKAHVSLSQVRKVLIHQANAKMDHAILERLFQLCGETDVPADIMPMTIDRLGNSSVATVPTLLDLLLHKKLNDHAVVPGDIILLASVGAGMNINAVVYRM